MTDFLGQWVATMDASADLNRALPIAATQLRLAAPVGTLAGGALGMIVGLPD
ncbi:hypothetical protein [Nocardia sp. NPDC004711]